MPDASGSALRGIPARICLQTALVTQTRSRATSYLSPDGFRRVGADVLASGCKIRDEGTQIDTDRCWSMLNRWAGFTYKAFKRENSSAGAQQRPHRPEEDSSGTSPPAGLRPIHGWPEGNFRYACMAGLRPISKPTWHATLGASACHLASVQLRILVHGSLLLIIITTQCACTCTTMI